MSVIVPKCKVGRAISITGGLPALLHCESRGMPQQFRRLITERYGVRF
jgi:hypothetical protein